MSERVITVPDDVVRRAAIRNMASPDLCGKWVEVMVAVDWPELQLTEYQVLANVCAEIAGVRPAPFPDHSIFSVRLPIQPEALGIKT